MPYTDLGEPRSRNEALLMNMLGASYEVEEPQSRIEYLLKEILDQGGTGGDVTGIKGSLEEAFRKGNVILALQNIAEVDNGIYFDQINNIIKGIQYTDMPTPAAALSGRIYQFVGTTTADYKNGHFYRCRQDGASYIWEDALGDETEPLTQEQLNALLALLD